MLFPFQPRATTQRSHRQSMLSQPKAKAQHCSLLGARRELYHFDAVKYSDFVGIVSS
jgi:hypothetical protein